MNKMNKKGLYGFLEEDDSIKIKNPTLDDLIKYQKHHMKMIETYAEQIAFINKLLSECREERKKFFMVDVPAIRQKLTEELIDKSVQDEWLVRLEKAMAHSFDESEKLASAFAVQKADEFREAMEDRLKGL